jgi:hypothetical protein
MRTKMMLMLTIALTTAAAGVAAAKNRSRTATVAVIGDTPYGAAQLAYFPTLRAAINADAAVSTVVHVGDIKNGSSLCTDEYNAQIETLFEGFTHPLVYSPGDNEWTDCHRKKAGKYDPLERLQAVRDVFFPTPGLTLGGTWPRIVFSQAWLPGFREFPENQLWIEGGVVFSAVHIVGSNNDLVPWFTDDATDNLVDDPTRRVGEWQRRVDADVAWLATTFITAELTGARGVVILTQADMWDGTPLDGFDATVAALAQLSAQFGKPVLLVNGDSHQFQVDHPLAEGSPVHHVTTKAPNLTRITVEGAENAHEYLRLTADPDSPTVFAWTRVPVAP